MSTLETTILALILGISCTFSTLSVSPARAGDTPRSCSGPDTTVEYLVAGTTLRGHGETLVHLEVAAAGIVTLDLLVPATTAAGRLISAEQTRDWALERSARHAVLVAPGPGRWTFRVAAEDPSHSLELWRLRSGFVPATSVREESGRLVGGRSVVLRQLHFDTTPAQKTEEQEIDPDPFTLGCDSAKTEEQEIDPDPFTLGCDPASRTEEQEIDPDPLSWDPILTADIVSTNTTKGPEQEIDPDPLTLGCDALAKTEEQEIDPDPFAGWEILGFRTRSLDSPKVPSAEHRIADSSCHQGTLGDSGDDHGDTLGCATQVFPGPTWTAELGNAWGDDTDVFTFTLEEPRTVILESRGEVDTLGTLFDRWGHRLAVDDDGGSGAGFRLVKVLAPGRYFLRVEGSEGAEGSYQLSFDTERF